MRESKLKPADQNRLPWRNIHEPRRDMIFTAVSLAATLLFFILPTGFEGAGQAAGGERARGKVIEVNNERLITIGPVKQGEQQLEVEIRSGRFKGQVFSGSNNLMGKIEMDKVAASKKKGLWMGGYPMLGYACKSRKLVINEDEAQVVKFIYEQFQMTESCSHCNGKVCGGRLYAPLQVRRILTSPSSETARI